MVGNEKTGAILLERIARAALNAVDLEGNSPLLLAARYGHIALVRVLIKARADLRIVNKAGHTAADAARSNPSTKKNVQQTVDAIIDAELDMM